MPDQITLEEALSLVSFYYRTGFGWKEKASRWWYLWQC